MYKGLDFVNQYRFFTFARSNENVGAGLLQDFFLYQEIFPINTQSFFSSTANAVVFIFKSLKS